MRQCKVNKKVLLRERKRHTDRRVASTLFVGWGGHIIPGGGSPHLDLAGGGVYPIPGGTPGYAPIWTWLGWYPWQGVPQGTPILTWPGVPHPWGVSLAGVPHPWGYPGVPSCLDQARGVPHSWWGYPHLDLARGYPMVGVPFPTRDGGYPLSKARWGYPPSKAGWGYPSPSGPGRGTPLPRCGLTNKVKI